MTVVRSLCPRDLVFDEIAGTGIELFELPVDANLNLAVWYKAADFSSNRAIVLIHGLTYSSLSVFDLKVPGMPRCDFSAVLRLARAGFHVFAVDMDGYGLSQARPGNTTLRQYCEDVKAVAGWICGARNLARPAVLGWSCGALTAARLASDPCAPISACIFYGSFWGGGVSGRPDNSRHITVPLGTRRFNGAEHASLDFRTPDYFNPLVRAYFVNRALQIDPSSPIAFFHHMANPSPLFEPLEIGIPVLAVRGSDDCSSTSADMKELLGRVPHGSKKYLEIPRSDHIVHMQNNRSLFFDGVVAFLKEFV